MSRLDAPRPPRFAACLRDLTARDSERRGSEGLLRAIFENQTEIIFRYWPDLRVISCNGAAARLNEADRQSLIGRHLLDDATEAARAALAAAFAALTPDAPVRHATEPKTLPNGRARWIDWTDRALFDEAGPAEPPHIGGFDIDVSAMKPAEAEPARARETLHETETMRALGGFAAGAAHELNNPLTVLAGQAEMLVEDVGRGPVADRADMIRRAVERCARIARSFLATARRKPPRRAPTDLNAVVEAALDLAAYTLRGAGVAATTRLAGPPPLLDAAADHLHQLALNLMLNAEQAMRGSADKPVLARHRDVEHHQLGFRPRVEHTVEIGAALGQLHGAAAPLQILADGLAQIRLVVADHDIGARRAHQARAGGIRGASAPGRERTNRAPPTPLSPMSRAPLCAAASLLQGPRPAPAPPSAVNRP